MKVLELIINDMNKEDVRFYKLFSTRLFYSHDRKDILLFDAIHSNTDTYDEEQAIRRLYNQTDKNSFYRLKNRLLSQVNKSLFLQHYENDDYMNALSLLAMYLFHASRNNSQAARHFLNKAEHKALSLEYLELLDIIYSEFIKLSIQSVDINPRHYIRKRASNLQRLQIAREIDQVLAAVTYQLKISQNYSQGGKTFIHTLEKIVRDHSTSKELKNSKLLEMKVAEAAARVLLQKHDYKTLETFLSGKLKEFKRRKFFSKSNHEALLQMLTYLVNASFKNQNNKQSLIYTHDLLKAMEAYDKLYFDKYFVFYVNAQVINYSILSPDRAITTLEDLKKNPIMKKFSFYEIFLYMNLALLYWKQKKHEKSIRQIIDTYLLDSFKKADESLKLKISIAELIVRFDMNDWDVVEYRIGQVRRQFRKILSSRNHLQEKEMLAIIMKLMSAPQSNQKRKLKQLIQQFIQEHRKQADEDSAIIRYIPWLEEKVIRFRS